MGLFKKKKSMAEIAQLMSEEIGCEIKEKDIKTDIQTETVEMYSVIIRDIPGDSFSGARNVTCIVRKYKRPYQYVLQVTRIS